MQQQLDTAALNAVLFVRHGSTAPNLAGLRCGGDLDSPLTELGLRQAERLAGELLRLTTPVGVILTSDLQRTRDTAAVISRALGGVPVLVQPAWTERRLGDWNLSPIADTQDALLAGRTPPGGESNIDFSRRIFKAALALRPWLGRRPLLVGSKGVARVLGEICGLPERVELDNCSMRRFDLSSVLSDEPAWETS